MFLLIRCQLPGQVSQMSSGGYEMNSSLVHGLWGPKIFVETFRTFVATVQTSKGLQQLSRNFDCFLEDNPGNRFVKRWCGQ